MKPLPGVKDQINLKLLAPDVAYDEQGNQGFWTLIYVRVFNFITI